MQSPIYRDPDLIDCVTDERAQQLQRTIDNPITQKSSHRARAPMPKPKQCVLNVLFRPLSVASIARLTGLSVVDVDHVLVELQRVGRVRINGSDGPAKLWEKVLT
jgi:predicted Rossmann fold nucleotide-binding protein DprA/Smf involved in DNA uptake